MSFFPEEPVPPERPAQPEREPDPPWFRPPAGEVPIVLPVSGLLARSQNVVVVLRGVRVFSNGMELEVQAKLRKADASEEQWEKLQGQFDEFGRSGRSETGRLRVGVLLADGSRAISGPRSLGTAEEGPGGYRLTRGDFSGTNSETFHRADWTFWLWPLPPDGTVTLIIDWPALDLPEQRFEFDGSAIGDAAERTTVIWPDTDADAAGARPSCTIGF